jgi:hypothetical protein
MMGYLFSIVCLLLLKEESKPHPVFQSRFELTSDKG